MADRGGLLGFELRGERDVDLMAGITDVGDGQERTGPFDDIGDRVAKSAGQHEVVIDGDVIAAYEPWRVPGGLA